MRQDASGNGHCLPKHKITIRYLERKQQYCSIEPQGHNILAVISYPFLPATTGGEISTLNILKYLSLRHKVTVFTVEPYSEKYDTGIAQFDLVFGMPFKSSRYRDIGLVPKLMKLAKAKKADWFFFDQPWFGWLMIMLKMVSGRKIFLRSNNIEYLRFRSMGKWFWQILYMYEKWTYRCADLVIFVSEADRRKAVYEFGLKEEKTLLTPYGVEAETVPEVSEESKKELRVKHNIAPEEHILLFFSTLSYFPNYEAVGFIARNIYPLLKERENFPFRILVCGKGLPGHILELLNDKPEIVYCGFVDDINMYIDGADIMINPLLSGGGVKTKAIDTLARNQRVISTRNGAEGIDPAVCGDNLIITPDNDWKAFTQAIVTYARTARSVPQAFYHTYGWPGIIDTLTQKL